MVNMFIVCELNSKILYRYDVYNYNTNIYIYIHKSKLVPGISSISHFVRVKRCFGGLESLPLEISSPVEVCGDRFKGPHGPSISDSWRVGNQ